MNFSLTSFRCSWRKEHGYDLLSHLFRIHMHMSLSLSLCRSPSLSRRARSPAVARLRLPHRRLVPAPVVLRQLRREHPQKVRREAGHHVSRRNHPKRVHKNEKRDEPEHHRRIPRVPRRIKPIRARCEPSCPDNHHEHRDDRSQRQLVHRIAHLSHRA